MSEGRLEVRLVSRAELPALARFLVSTFGKDETEDYWLARFRHWWDSNPYFSEQIPRGWALFLGRRIKGFLGNFPTPLRIGRDSEVAFNMTTWRVADEAQTSSMRLLFAYMEAAKGRYVFATTPNEDVRKILTAMKFERVPFETDDIARLFTSGSGVENALRARRVPAFAARLVAAAADPFIRWSFRIHVDFDGVWNSGWDSNVERALLRRFSDCAVTTLRTRQLYEWYGNARNSEYEYLLVREHGIPTYFAVVRWYTVAGELQGEIQEGLALGRIVRAAAGATISCIARRAAYKGAGRIFVYGHAPDLIEEMGRFRHSGIGRRKGKEFYRAPESIGEDGKEKRVSVFFSRLQGDIGI